MAVCRDKPPPTVPLHGLQPEEPYPLAPLLCRNSPVTAQSLPWPSCPPPHGGRTACARLHSEPCVGVDSLPAWPCPPPLPTTPCYSPHGHRWVTLKYPCATPARSSVRGVVSPGSPVVQNCPVTARSLPWPSCPPPPWRAYSLCAPLPQRVLGRGGQPPWPCPPPLPTTSCYSPHGH
jgi:hypothetical protein